MPTTTLITTCALALLTLAACEGETHEAQSATPLTAELQHVLDSAVEQSDALLPGAITYYQATNTAAWSGSAGESDMQAHAEIHPQARLRAGSILKTFLATVTLQHVEEGTLSLDQKIVELLPSDISQRIAHADRITLRMLLGHTSGIPEWDTPEVDRQVAEDPTHIWTEAEEVEIASKQDPWFEPGTSYRYSNTNYTLVGLILDGLGEGSWREQVRQRVLTPLALHATSLPEPGDLSLPQDLAHGYQAVNDTTLDLSKVDSSMAGAAGGHALMSSAQDLGKFLTTLLAGKLFAHADTLNDMTNMIDAPDESGVPHRYGLGLESYTLPSGTEVIGHGGTTAGYALMMFRIPERDATLVTAVTSGDMLTNAEYLFMPSVGVIDQRP